MVGADRDTAHFRRRRSRMSPAPLGAYRKSSLRSRGVPEAFAASGSVRRFTEMMPQPWTEKERIAHEIRARIHRRMAIKDDALTR